MKLRTKIILFFIILSSLLFFVVGYYLRYSVRDSFKEQITDQARVNVEMLEGTYYTFIRSLGVRAIDWSSDLTIRAAAEEIINQNISPERRSRAAVKFAESFRSGKFPYESHALFVDLLNEQGIVVASTKEDRVGRDELMGQETDSSQYFLKVINSSGLAEVFMRGVIYGEGEGSEVMTRASIRVFSVQKDAQGKLIPLPAVLAVYFSVTDLFPAILSGEFQESVGALTGGAFLETYKSANVFLVNKDRRVIATAKPVDDLTALENQIVIGVANDCLQNGVEVSKEMRDLRGKDVILSSMCLSRDELVLITKVDSAEAFSVYSGLVQKTYVGGVLLFTIVIVALLAVLSRPLRELTVVAKIASDVAKGNFALRTNIKGGDEIGEFAHVFNLMLDRIEVTQKEMESDDFEIKKKSEELTRSLAEYEKQNVFLEDSKRAQLNLLEDAWQAKKNLEKEKVRLQTILSSIGDGLVLIDRQYRIALANPKIGELFGIPPSELLGKSLHEVMKLWKKRSIELDPAQWPIEEMFLTRKIVMTDMEDDLSLTTAKKETHLPIALSIAPLGEEGAGAVIVIRDVSEDRALDDAKSGFISIASHQLRTPLTTIRWYAEMLLSGDAGEVSDDQRDFLSEIHGGAERLYQTIDLLLGISRVESGKMKTEKTDIDVSVFMEGITKELSPLVKEKDLSLRVVPPTGEPVVVYLDPLTLRQVVINLLSNAIRYTNEKGEIEVRWWRSETGDGIVYSVRDNGIGIPEAQRSRIFTKFFRAENALSKVPDGSGLGLALIKELVEAWGGKVWFETALGKGTTFFFTIPLVSKVPLPSVAEEGEHGMMEANK